ncbi:LysR family transcriptional regulator [Alcaligenaceae bacterium]|nr:LysR family transcriptional regulator [Alcaligenaceae bacterium]
MKFNLRQIEVFRAIMITGSISNAAKLLHVSQPAVSRLLSHTENRLDICLFQRVKSRLYPTPEANLLFKEVQGVYDGIYRINETAVELRNKKRGLLRFVVNPSLGQTLAPLIVQHFGQKNPHVRINMQTLVAHELIDALIKQKAEVGIAVTHQSHPNLKTQLIHENPLAVVVHKSHPYAQKKQIHIKELSNQKLIGYGVESPIGRLLQTLFNQHDVTVHNHIEVRLTSIAVAMAQAGAGLAIVDLLAGAGQIWPDVVLRPLIPATALPINLLYSSTEPLSLIAQDLLYATQKAVAEVTT